MLGLRGRQTQCLTLQAVYLRMIAVGEGCAVCRKVAIEAQAGSFAAAGCGLDERVFVF